MNWRKSTFSENGGDSCVETASNGGAILVRDTTNRDGFTMEIPAAAWSKFTASLR